MSNNDVIEVNPETMTTPQTALVVIPVAMMDRIVTEIKRKEKEYFREKQEWVKIGAGKHLCIEGWVTLGNFFGLGARSKILDDKRDNGDIFVKASSSIVRCDTGIEVAYAEQIATRFGMRAKMGGREINDHEVYGMAQTRATSRAYANILRGIAKKLGFNTTPAEEMATAGNGRTTVNSTSNKASVKDRFDIVMRAGKEAGVFVMDALKKAGIETVTPKNIDDVEQIIENAIIEKNKK